VDKLTRADLYSLEDYASARRAFRERILAHKQHRQIAVGPHATLYFEDRLTVQYQIQEMLRVERIFEPSGIEEELAAYNSLIPDGQNLKATFMLEYIDAEERRLALSRMIGIEHKVWIAVDDLAPVWAIADEDLDRSDADKTSAVHFLRFEFTPQMVQAAAAGARLGIGIDHDAYRHRVDPLPPEVRASLLADIVR